MTAEADRDLLRFVYARVRDPEAGRAAALLPLVQAADMTVTDCEVLGRYTKPDASHWEADERTPPEIVLDSRRSAYIWSARIIASMYADHPDYDESWRP